MKKTAVAFDIGESYIKIAKREGNQITAEAIQMPDNLMTEGVVQMPHALTDFLKGLKKEKGLKTGPCGMVVPDEVTVCRTISLPAMTEAQLEVNLPFEFSDYISNDPQNYVYDYAIQEMKTDEEGKPTEMTLTGAVMSKENVLGYVNSFKNAKFRLRTLIPLEVSIENIMKAGLEAGKIQKDKEYCLVNLGHRTTQVYIYKNGKQQVLRNLHVGNNELDKAISEHKSIDEFLARTYKNSNYHGIWDEEYCQEAFGRLAIEIRKVINFYRFNNREAQLEDIYFFGGGSNIKPLCDSIGEYNDMVPKNIMDLLPDYVNKNANPISIFAIGVLLQ